MAPFKSIELAQKAHAFKKFLKALDTNVKAWAYKSGIADVTCYKYIDPNQEEYNLPAFVLSDHPNCNQILAYLQVHHAINKESSTHYASDDLLGEFAQMTADFAKLIKSFSDAISPDSEGGKKITEKEFKKFEKAWNGLLATGFKFVNLIEKKCEENL